jgi:glutamate-ammonia-ligase adenylyltransferase
MKARAVGGSRDFEAKVERVALDAAYSLPLTAEHLDRIEEIRIKLRDSVTPGDLKRGEGGLGELEFGVRLLQLKSVAEHPAVRTQRVDDALAALCEARVVSEETRDGLIETYNFYRRIENRIRLRRGQSGSALPESEDERADLARRLGIEGDLSELVAQHRERVHAFYAGVFEELRARA